MIRRVIIYPTDSLLPPDAATAWVEEKAILAVVPNAHGGADLYLLGGQRLSIKETAEEFTQRIGWVGI